jgi:hypothetical protein
MTNASAPAGQDRWLRLAGAIALGVTLLYAVVSAVVRPAMYSDSAWGFVGWYSGKGLPFNYAMRIDPADISKDVIVFSTWWSPGQHVLPGLLEMAGLDLGQAITVVVLLCSLLGLVGWFFLYRDFGFPATSSALAVAIIALTRHFALPFGIYNGGEVLLFGVAPWFILLVWRLRRFEWWAVLPLLAGAALMVFAKLSGLVLSAATIGAAVMAPVGPWFAKERLRRAVVAAAAVAATGMLFYVVWFSRGSTPTEVRAEAAWSIGSYLAYVTSASWSAALSLGDLAAWILLHPSRPVFRSASPIYWLFLPLALATFALVGWRLWRSHAEYLRFAVFLGLGVGVVLVTISASGAGIGTEERHLRIVSLVLFVGIVHSVLGMPGRWVRALFAGVVVVACFYGVTSAAMRAMANSERPLGWRGFRHLAADQALIDHIRSIDTLTPDRHATLIMVTAPDIALEVRNVRVISNHVDFDPMERLEAVKLHGRVPRLHVLVEERLVGQGKAEKMLRSFVDYTPEKWHARPIGGFVDFSAIQ